MEAKPESMRDELMVEVGQKDHEGIKSETNWAAALGVIAAIVIIVARQLGVELDPSGWPSWLEPAQLGLVVSGIVAFVARIIINLINKKIKK